MRQKKGRRGGAGKSTRFASKEGRGRGGSESPSTAEKSGLSSDTLDVVHNRILTWHDPNKPHNVVTYDYLRRSFIESAPMKTANLAVHFSMSGSLCHPDALAVDDAADAEYATSSSGGVGSGAAAKEGDGAEGDEQGGGFPPPSVSSGTSTSTSDKNQFNYSERACQTFNNPVRERGVATVPPELVSFSANVSQWEIYDKYMKAWGNASALREEGAAADGSASVAPPLPVAAHSAADDEDVVHSAAMGTALRLLERMVTQNSMDELYRDFKYWEDRSDLLAGRDMEGSLLPLWDFSVGQPKLTGAGSLKLKTVTSIAWHPTYDDMFAVGFGSFDFMRKGRGLVHCYTLKNTASPEYAFSTMSGVMCVDWHTQHHSLLAVGTYDGNVAVFDVRRKEDAPLYVSSVKTGKHTDPVWQISWQDEDLSKDLNFYSVSSDGTVANWVMTTTELKMEPVMQLKHVTGSGGIGGELDDEVAMGLTGLASGCCFDFNKVSEHLFVVGTEEGKVHKCSKAYSGHYLETYDAHHMAVYAVKWNTFHPRIFLSCSADWTVKVRVFT